MSGRSRAGILGGAVGIAAAGGAAAAAVSTRSRHRRSLADPVAPEPPATRVSTVAAADGVPLVVEEVGERDAPLTVVLVHGFCLAMESWHFQREVLAARPGTRVVLYDQRGHGRSGTPRQATCTIDQLGRDLQEVLGAVVPRGPVVLVGHSMGGMTVMALARQRPDLFTARVVGVGLLSTAADGLALGRLGVSARNPVISGLRRLSRVRPSLLQLGRTPLDALISPLVRAMSYGDRRTSPAVAEMSELMIARTAVRTIADFVPTLVEHDEHAALPVLAGRPVLVLCGDADRLTPLRQTRVIADEIGEAHLVVAPGAGHLVQMEQPGLVNAALERLLERATAHRAAARA